MFFIFLSFLLFLPKLIMKILVSGSMAYDYIMDFQDSFKNHILPDKIHMLNVSFFTPSLTKQKWWTGHNIAYNMWLLWEKSILLWVVGNDFNEKSKLIDYSNLYKIKDMTTASCYIINDKDNNQINAFYPWALSAENTQNIPNLKISYAIISPNGKDVMIKHLKQASELDIKTFFDPGQMITSFTKEELIECLDYSNYLVLNDYEYNLFLEKTWFKENNLLDKLDKIIITLWKDWVRIVDKKEELKIEAVKNISVIDPTWAWDSFRAWLIVWLHNWLNWERSARIWCLNASYCIEKYGTQNHIFTKKEFEKKYKEEFKEKIEL